MNARPAGFAMLGFVTLAACRDDEPYEGAFDQPIATAVLDPAAGGPFIEPVGYVANAHGGQIVPLALKAGRFLTDDRHASFLRSAPLATGGARALTSVTTWAPDAATVSVFAGDARFSRLLRVRHVVGVGESGAPEEYEASLVGEPAFFGGEAPTIEVTKVRTGFATSEVLSLASDGARWWVTGSRSGRHEHPAEPGVPYTSDRGGVELTIGGPGAPGDRFELTLDAGVDELDVGGVPTALATRPDQGTIAMIVDPGLDHARLAWLDPASFAEVAGPALPPGAEPTRLTWSADGARLWVADAGLPAVWEVRPDSGEVLQHVVPWPVQDVAELANGDVTRLFLVPRASGELWALDVGADGDTLVDANAWVPGVQGLDLHEPIAGIEAIPVDYRLPEPDANGVRPWGRSVAVALSAARMVFVDEATACLVAEQEGPRSVASASFGTVDYDTNFDGIAGGPVLSENGDGTRHVVVNPCSGLSREETWTLTFDASRQGWEVEGSLSGVQPTLAYEGVRYVSDDGAVSFLIEPGSVPSQDGWQIAFAVDPGRFQITSESPDGSTVAFEVPTDPVFFHYRVGPTDNGWDPVDDRPFLLVAGAASNSVQRADPSDGTLEVDWR